MTQELWLQNPAGLIPRGTPCASCGRYNARDITCCVIAYVDGKVLLIKRGHEPSKGAWALPGGYLGWNETLLEAATREFYEETGLTTGKLHLIGTRSDDSAGDGRQNVDIYFYTSQVSGALVKQPGEVTDIEWFTPEKLPTPLAFNHAFLLQSFLPAITVAPTQPVPVVL